MAYPHEDAPFNHANATPDGSDVSFVSPTNFEGKQFEINCRELFIGGAGNVAVEMLDGEQLTYNITTVPFILPGRFVKVLNTGTTATNIIVRW